MSQQHLNAHQRTVYATLGKREGLTVAELAASFTGMSQTTVRKVLRELQDMQLVLVDYDERPYVWKQLQAQPVEPMSKLAVLREEVRVAVGHKPKPNVSTGAPYPRQVEVEALRARLAEAKRTIEFLMAQNHRLLWGKEGESC